VRILKLFFQFKVPHLELVDCTLILLLFFLHYDVRLGEFGELMLELSELLVKLIHGHLVCSSVVIKLSLKLSSLILTLRAFLLEVFCSVSQIVPLLNQVFDINLQVFTATFKLGVDLKNVNFVELCRS